jgi:uncharacterized membrane protein YhdT
MQALGATSILLCVISMFMVFAEHQPSAQTLFGLSLICTMIALVMSIVEISISTNAVKLQLSDIDPQKLKTFF